MAEAKKEEHRCPFPGKCPWVDDMEASHKNDIQVIWDEIHAISKAIVGKWVFWVLIGAFGMFTGWYSWSINQVNHRIDSQQEKFESIQSQNQQIIVSLQVTQTEIKTNQTAILRAIESIKR